VFFCLSCADKSRRRKRRSRTEGGSCKQKAIGCSCRNDRPIGPILSTCWRPLRPPKFASSGPAEAKLLLDRRSLKLVSSGVQGIAGYKQFLPVLRASHHGSRSCRLKGHKILNRCGNNLPISMLPPVIHGFHRGRSFQSSKPKFFENPCLSDYGNGLILRDRRRLSRPGAFLGR
jgi:hypothetical protein